ncbi:MAG: zinc ribbon domain-containing protein [Promethearchaeota archaeon]
MPIVRNYIWILPLIGSILTFISLFTPAAVYYSGSGNIFRFMDGVYVESGGLFSGPSFRFTNIPSVVIVGIISMIIIIICTIIMFISSLTHRNKETPGSWLALGIILIGGAIYYIVGTQIAYMFYGLIHDYTAFNFWRDFVPSFATIAPFITGGISIVAFIIGKTTSTEKVEIKPISKEESPISEPISQPIPIEETHSVKFCPACGEKIPHAEAQFCPSCGTDLKN